MNLLCLSKEKIINYYPFHLGDYATHTAHLEPMEDLAYRRLLDLYYLREGPLPLDIQVTAKLVRMRSMAADVESVLNEFFLQTDEGWRHARCDEELGKMIDKQIKAKASAAASVKARQAFAEKKKQTCSTNVEFVSTTNAEEYVNERSTNADENAANAELPTPTPTPTPVIKNTSAIAPPDGVVESVWSDFCQHRKSKKAKLTQTAIEGIASEAAKAGWSMNDALRECCIRGWIGFKAEWVAKDQKTIDAENSVKRGSDEYAKLHKSAAWWANAGFESVWNAMDAGCYHDTANRFADGKKLCVVAA